MTEIASVQDIKTYLGVPDGDDSFDSQLQFFVDALPAYVFTQTRRWFGCLQTATETHDFRPVIFLDQMDIASIEYIKSGYSNSRDYDNDTSLVLLDPTTYRWADTGRVQLSDPYLLGNFRYSRDQVVVKYQYGNENVPADIKLAATQFAADGFRAIDGEVTSEQVDSFRKTYKPNSQSAKTFSDYGQ